MIINSYQTIFSPDEVNTGEGHAVDTLINLLTDVIYDLNKNIILMDLYGLKSYFQPTQIFT